jgi:hypothetical protein
MKETDQELSESLELQLSLLRLIAGTEEGLPERIPVERDAEVLEQLVRTVSREAA